MPCGSGLGVPFPAAIVRDAALVLHGSLAPQLAPQPNPATQFLMARVPNTLLLTSLSPLRSWELDLRSRTCVLQAQAHGEGGRSQVTLPGSSVQAVAPVLARPTKVLLRLRLPHSAGGHASRLLGDGQVPPLP